MLDTDLSRRLAEIDRSIAETERRLAGAEGVPVEQAVEVAVQAADALVRAAIQAEGDKPAPPDDADLLGAFRALARGDPSWNAIRENLRELVYYRNCVALGRRDALPAVPERMAVRLARHVYLYVKTRCEREGRL